jgi:hypothetical protein
MRHTKHVYNTYFSMNNRKCVVLWVAMAYTRQKHSTKRRLWAGKGGGGAVVLEEAVNRAGNM